MTRSICRLLWVGMLLIMLTACASSAPAQTGQATPTVQATPSITAPTVVVPPLLPYEKLLPLYNYNQKAPLDIKWEDEKKEQQNITVKNLTYASPKGGRVPTILVVPPGKGPFAAMVWMHPSGGTRTYYLYNALELAKKGVVSILIDAPYLYLSKNSPFSFTLEDRDIYIRNIVDLRRAVDLLLEEFPIDQKRMGFAGYSLGALLGGVFAGIEKRLSAFALQAGGGKITDFLSEGNSDSHQKEYLKQMEVLDAIHYIGHAAPASILIQHGLSDTTIQPQNGQLLYQAASSPKTIKWYDVGHNFDPVTDKDLLAWLSQQLHL
jgi:cephalosporin-C deacetylase-like acetyl esterase